MSPFLQTAVRAIVGSPETRNMLDITRGLDESHRFEAMANVIMSATDVKQLDESEK